VGYIEWSNVSELSMNNLFLGSHKIEHGKWPQTVRYQPLTIQGSVQYQVIPRWIRVQHSLTGIGSSPHISVFHCQYNPTCAAGSLIPSRIADNTLCQQLTSSLNNAIETLKLISLGKQMPINVILTIILG